MVLMALAVRLAVPLGFMPVATASGVAIMPCPAAGAVPVAMAAMHHGHGRESPGKTDTACPFAGLSLPSIAGADAAWVVAVVVAVLAAGLRPLARWPRRDAIRWRPPSQGPPARA
ncbi:hypothetical protein [Sphingomonas sp. CROZ-RG-20F-R02-07]|uniref:hypothetical protein n=1 Tax=Sphingomonas sp. CROZ-RG-20F-R02-07 TaxID=2914832 RepID=UPI001F566340|nr:hypothetical protein [Sphingomonas sp. CROZ-RG-20F-R02-07]